MHSSQMTKQQARKVLEELHPAGKDATDKELLLMALVEVSAFFDDDGLSKKDVELGTREIVATAIVAMGF